MIDPPSPLPPWLDRSAREWPRLTDGSRPRGRWKTQPEDFVVEEIPAYEPSGQGEHLFLWIEKVDVAAEQLTRHLAQTLGISTGEIGVAGLKDRRAVTRQYVSVPVRVADRLAGVTSDRIRVLRATPHGNKLKTGHLRGNRFEILIRPAAADIPVDEAPFQHLTRLAQEGFPNYFGDQRFGQDHETLLLGWELLQGRRSPRSIPPSRRRFLLRLALSAVQSALFNQALASRLTDELLRRALLGDVMEVTASGGKFVVTDSEREQPRLEAGEIVVTGPLFGPKMRQPTDAVAEREAELLRQAELQLDQFSRFGDLLSGTRRPYVVIPQEVAGTCTAEGWRLQFTLPSGSYATVLLAELFSIEVEDRFGESQSTSTSSASASEGDTHQPETPHSDEPIGEV